MKGFYFDTENPAYDRELIFLVEGDDDAMFIEAILQDLLVAEEKARIVVCQGKQRIRDHIKFISKSSQLHTTINSIVVAIDSDEDPQKSLFYVHSALRDSGFATPDAYDFSAKSAPRVGIILLPSSTEVGELESLAIKLFPDNDVKDFALRLVDAATAADPTLRKVSKRRAQALLAGMSKKIRNSVGWAFHDGTISVSSPELRHIRSFLLRVL